VSDRISIEEQHKRMSPEALRHVRAVEESYGRISVEAQAARDAALSDFTSRARSSLMCSADELFARRAGAAGHARQIQPLAEGEPAVDASSLFSESYVRNVYAHRAAQLEGEGEEDAR
jgi:hypothetical protein